MDVIINNPAAQPQVQYAPITQTPYGYGPGYGAYQEHHHGGPGFLLPLLLLGGFLFFRAGAKRRRMMRRWQRAGGQHPAAGPFAAPAQGAPDFVDDIRENFKRGRERFFSDRALEIARERYARGEINADEYQALVKALSGETGAQGRVNIDSINMDKGTPPDII